jgi:hypothetical protein
MTLSKLLIDTQRVVNVLAPNEDIHISNQTVDQLSDIKEVTHIIFSSTIPVKYEISLVNSNNCAKISYLTGIVELNIICVTSLISDN